MYAYVDETGNTGKNIFDENQPLFITAALLTKENFDVVYKERVIDIAKLIGEIEIHANIIGVGKVELIAEQLLLLFQECDAYFFISRIEKKYLGVSKFVDTLFDSYENKAVPWHVYNVRHLRLLMVFKIASILDQKSMQLFWSAITEPKETKAKVLFLESLDEIRKNAESLQDARLKELITQAIDWAKQNPESIYIHVNSKAARTGHLPNLAVFPNLLEGIEQRSKIWDRKVIEVVHDRQTEFEKMLRHWHTLFKDSPADEIKWTMGEKYTLQRLEGSSFRISSAVDSAGIQAIDTVLWLFKRVLENKQIGENSKKLMDFVFVRGYQNDLSFECVGQWLENQMREIFSKPLSVSDKKRAEESMVFSEQRRRAEMEDYALAKRNSDLNEKI